MSHTGKLVAHVLSLNFSIVADKLTLRVRFLCGNLILRQALVWTKQMLARNNRNGMRIYLRPPTLHVRLFLQEFERCRRVFKNYVEVILRVHLNRFPVYGKLRRNNEIVRMESKE